MKTDLINKINIIKSNTNINNPIILLLVAKGILSEDELSDIEENDKKILEEWIEKNNKK